MACDFCRNTSHHSADPCPVCTPADHSGNTRLRKAHKPSAPAPKARPVPHVMDAHGFRPVGAPVPGTNSRARYTPPPPQLAPQQRADVDRLKASMTQNANRAFPVGTPNRAEMIAANERRIRDLEAELARRNATPRQPPTSPPIAPLRPAQPARVGILTPITPEDWRAAERFVRSTLWAPKLPATVDSVAKVVTQRDEEATHPPISRGDFRGLWIAVEAGHLTEAAAIELAASWQVRA